VTERSRLPLAVISVEIFPSCTATSRVLTVVAVSAFFPKRLHPDKVKRTPPIMKAETVMFRILFIRCSPYL